MAAKRNNQTKQSAAKAQGKSLRASKQAADEELAVTPLVESSAYLDILGVAIAVAAVTSFIAVVSPESAPVTKAVSSFFHFGFGLGAYVLPLVILLAGASLFLGERSPLNGRTVSGGVIVFLSVISLLSLVAPGTDGSSAGMFEPEALVSTGGYVGAFIASTLQNLVGKVIAGVILVGLLVVGFIVIGFSVSRFMSAAAEKAQAVRARRMERQNAAPWGDEAAFDVPAAQAGRRRMGFGELNLDSAQTTLLDDADDVDEDPFVDLSDQLAEEAQTTLLDDSAQTTPMDDAAPAAATAVTAAAAVEAAPKTTLIPKAAEGVKIPDFLLKPKGKGGKAKAESAAAAAAGSAETVKVAAPKAAVQADSKSGDAPKGEGEIQLPPRSLLKVNPKSGSSSSSNSELKQTAEALQSTLEEFGRSARVVGWIAGPTVTTFKIQPGEGERVSKISSLEDDIALSLAAQSVRIFAPIPGTSLIGIEIPNQKRTNVFLGDVLPYVKGGPLELAIGRDAEGSPIVADLAKMPHLLIAGTTGSGKSVMINSIITTLIMRTLPEDCRLIMVDPKRVELAGYNKLPHLYVPVVTEPKQAASALQWAVSEMERRLKVFERLNVRKISTYNEKQQAGEFDHYDNPPKKMPYLVIIIDELSDLMMVAGKDVEASIVRIAQLGRAAGIHLIVATQRPSSNVVTGLIKANITNRIAFNVATGIDSRVIIDQMGAEKLTGLGDMLFSKVDWGKPRRIQGCFVSDEEIASVVSFVESQSEPDYHEEILSVVSPAVAVATGAGPVRTGTAAPEEDDPLIWEAARIVVDSQLGSTSGLQRRLKVGYARAGRIMDMLEEKGVVGPPDGSKPREVLLDAEGLASLEHAEMKMAQEDLGFGDF